AARVRPEAGVEAAAIACLDPVDPIRARPELRHRYLDAVQRAVPSCERSQFVGLVPAIPGDRRDPSEFRFVIGAEMSLDLRIDIAFVGSPVSSRKPITLPPSCVISRQGNVITLPLRPPSRSDCAYARPSEWPNS